MAETLAKNPTPMNYHSALNVVRDIVKANPDAILVNEGANALDFTRSIVDMYKPRKRLDVGTWGVMGIGMGFSVAAAVVSGEQVIAVEGDSAFGFSGMEVETICRYNLPVCVVIMNNNGVYRGDEVNPTGGRDPSPLVFVKGARYEKLMEAFGGVGVLATTPAELRNAMEEAIRSRKPTLINAVIDEKAGTESGRITSLNPDRQEEIVKQLHGVLQTPCIGERNGQGTGRRAHPRFHARAIGTDLHAAAGVARRRRDQGRTRGRGRHHARAAARHSGRRQPLFHDAEPQQALDHRRRQASERQGDPRSARQEVRRAGREFRARRARPDGLHLGAHQRSSIRG